MREDCQGRHGPRAWPFQALGSSVRCSSERVASSQAGEPVTCYAGDSRVGVLGCASGHVPRQAVPGWIPSSSVAASVNQATFKSLAILGLRV